MLAWYFARERARGAGRFFLFNDVSRNNKKDERMKREEDRCGFRRRRRWRRQFFSTTTFDFFLPFFSFPRSLLFFRETGPYFSFSFFSSPLPWENEKRNREREREKTQPLSRVLVELKPRSFLVERERRVSSRTSFPHLFRAQACRLFSLGTAR